MGELLDVIDTLRQKCPWDSAQTPESLRPNTIEEAMEGIDALLVLVDVTAIGPHDRSIVEEMSHKKVYKLLVLNKIDLVEPKNLLSIIDSFKDAHYDGILPVSAKSGDGVDALKADLAAHLPIGPKYFRPQVFPRRYAHRPARARHLRRTDS